jgi:hypothetical protein
MLTSGRIYAFLIISSNAKDVLIEGPVFPTEIFQITEIDPDFLRR